MHNNVNGNLFQHQQQFQHPQQFQQLQAFQPFPQNQPFQPAQWFQQIPQQANQNVQQVFAQGVFPQGLQGIFQQQPQPVPQFPQFQQPQQQVQHNQFQQLQQQAIIQDVQQKQDQRQQQETKFSTLLQWKPIDMTNEEYCTLFHSALFQFTLSADSLSSDSEMKKLATFIKENLLDIFKKSVKEKPDNFFDFIYQLCLLTLSENDLPNWVKTSPTAEIILDDHNSILAIKRKLIQQCRDNNLPLNYEELKLLGLEDWMSLKESPLHLILSHGPLNFLRQQAILKLVKMWPSLLVLPDEKGETPIDILFKAHKDMTDGINLINELLRISIVSFLGFLKENSYAPIRDAQLAHLSLLCYAKEAKKIIPKNWKGTISISFNDSIPPMHNPLLVCSKLKKMDLVENVLDCITLDSQIKIPKKLACAIIMGEPSLAISYIKEYNIALPSLAPYLSQLFKMGCTELVNEIIKAEADSLRINCSNKTKRIVAIFRNIPELLDKENFINELKEDDLPLLIHQFKSYPALKISDAEIQQDIYSQLLKKILEIKLLDSVDGVFVSYLIPFIYKKDKIMAEELIKELGKQPAIKESLFSNVCYNISLVRDLKINDLGLEELFEWLIPFLNKEDFPVSFSTSILKLIILKISVQPEPHINLFLLNLIERYHPKEQIIEVLNLRDANGCLPIEALCNFYGDDEARCSLIEKFLSFGAKLEDIKNPILARNLIAKVIVFGSEKLNNLIEDYIENSKDWLVSNEINQKKIPGSFQPISSSGERIKKFLTFCNLFPKGMSLVQIFSIPVPFYLKLLLENIFNNPDLNLIDEWLDVGNKFTGTTLNIVSVISAYSKIDLDLLEKFLKSGNFAVAKVNVWWITDWWHNHDPSVMELFLDYLFNGEILPLKSDSPLAYHSSPILEKFLNHVLNKLSADELGDYNVYIENDQNKFKELVIVNAQNQEIARKVGTTKKIYSLIKEDREKRQKALEMETQKALLRDTNYLYQNQREFQEKEIAKLILQDSSIVNRHGFINGLGGIISPVWIANYPNDEIWKVFYADYETGTIGIQNFSYDREGIIKEIVEFIDLRLALFEDRKEQINLVFRYSSSSFRFVH